MDLYNSHDLKIENKKIVLYEFLSMLRKVLAEKKLAVFCYYLLMQKKKKERKKERNPIIVSDHKKGKVIIKK